MFDYAAGEKFKLTLIMVAAAGVMAGMFFTLLLMPTPEPQTRRARPHAAWMDNPDVTGRAGQSPGLPSEGMLQGNANPNPDAADPATAVNLVQQWLPLVWDLSAGSAKASQEKAILYMTTECASAYRQNIWTPEIAQQIEQSGVKSSFKADKLYPGGNQSDGSVVVFVEGEQVLSVPSKGQKVRSVKLEYLVKKTPDGLRIAGISEGGQSG
jgi:hypothetical protein